ncbi:MFS transporter [Paenibacillus melissococcoides]|uniref:MFS transporter n=1 Tax=Paenibacillus melissococcoides TaxID=2912268 RepID=A0ABM9G5Q2_9BACL|nr:MULTISPECIES: MFS transporter [Paenibacillus]MEB9892315.1 MFS transporter [Bacillus cereus]CAH8246692.1 MFS transporter [Paenibacillus melissococcoides]CAH8715466.1 MFS transporter [Paenibacillus melissococcoides]CAH8716428.1 MFS transporter [Paenibacillus melissococcoides]
MLVKFRMGIMFLIVLCGMISIAAFNPIIGPLSRHLGLSELQSGCLVSITGLTWLLGGYFWEKMTFMSRKKMLALIMVIYVATLVVFAQLADYAESHFNGAASAGLFWTLLLLRTAAGFFFGGIPAMAQAYVMGWTTAETRTRGMALFGAANGLGFVLGPAMSGGLAAIGLTAPMYGAAALLFVTALLFRAAIAEEPVRKVRKQAARASLSPTDSRIRLYLWVGLLFVALGLLGLLMLLRFAYLDFAVLGIGIGFTLLGYSAGASMAVRDEEQRTVASYIAALQGGGSFLGPVTGTALYTAHLLLPYSFCVLLIAISAVFAMRRKGAPRAEAGMTS